MKDRLSFISFERSISFLVFTIFITFFHFSESHSQPYLRYFKNGKVGYIDTTGKVVIKARFAQAGDFSEGLAPVRLEGLYGFIDVNGNYVIPPKYDFANSFKEGFAIVYVDSVPMYIDKKGNIPFSVKYDRLYDFERGIAEVKTGDTYTLINKEGKEIASNIKRVEMIDTSGIYALYKPGKMFNEPMYVIDKSGKILIPEGIYRNIFQFSEGFAYVDRGYDSEHNPLWGFVNRDFIEVLTRNKMITNCSGYFHEGLVDVTIMNDTIQPEYLRWRKYHGYMDTLGKVVISDRRYYYCGDFENGVASVERVDDWIKINKNGEVVCDSPCENVVFEKMNGGKIIYRDKKYYFKKSAVDSSEIEFDNINFRAFSDSNTFIFGKNNQPKKYLSGICGKDGKILLEPVIYKYENTKPLSNVIRAVIDKKRCYVNNIGKIIWMESDNEPPDTLDLDYNNNNHPYEKAINRIQDLKFKTSNNNVNVIVKDDERTFTNRHLTRKVYIINNSKDSIWIPEYTDIFGFIVCQVLTNEGVWKNIEGWGIHPVWNIFTLAPNNSYEVHTPVYKGTVKMKMRYIFKYRTWEMFADSEGSYVHHHSVYSNEFYGYVNPAQVWRNTMYMGSPDKYEDFFGRR